MTKNTAYAGYNLAAVEAAVLAAGKTEKQPETTSTPHKYVGYNLAAVQAELEKRNKKK